MNAAAGAVPGLSVEQLLLIIVTAAVCSIFLNVFLKRMGMPPALGYIIAGVIIASIFNLQNLNNKILHDIAEFGIVFMLFTIGLEFSINTLREMYKEVVIHGILQFLITATVFYFITRYLFNIDIKGSILTGSAIALSSTSIVLKYFNDQKEMDRTYARESVGILIFQDLAVIAILIMGGMFANESETLGVLLARTAVGATIVLALLFLLGRYVLNHFFKWVTDTHSHEIFISAVLFIVVSAAILAHEFGFTYSLGAFVAGMMIAETQYKYQVEADLTPFRDLLLGVFFVSVGMQIDLVFFADKVGDVLLIVTAVLVIKAVIIYAILRFSHWSSTALKAGISLAQIGEFSFVIFELARSNDLITNYFSQLMIVSVAVSMMITPFILTYNEVLIKTLRRVRKEEEPIITKEPPTDKMSDHVVVIGYGFHGRRVVESLSEMKVPYIAVDFRAELVERGRQNQDNVIFGNAAQKSILKKVGIKSAIAAIIAIENEKMAALITQRITEIGDNINIVVKVSDMPNFESMVESPKLFVVDGHREIAKTLVRYAITCDIDQKR